jgi:hypothetical protein
LEVFLLRRNVAIRIHNLVPWGCPGWVLSLSVGHPSET